MNIWRSNKLYKYNNKIYAKNNGDLDISSSIKIFRNWKKNHYKIYNKFEKNLRY